MKNDNVKFKVACAVILIALCTVGRFFLISYVKIPNFEIITATSLISGLYMGGLFAIIVPIATVFLSDLVIGNSRVFLFTWSAFAFIGLFGYLYGKSRFTVYDSQFTKDNQAKLIFDSIILGIGSSIFFYLYTNFGWWLVSGMYPHTLNGLIQSYIMGLPFFRNNLIGNLIFVPTAVFIANYIFLIKNREIQVKKLYGKI